MENNELIIQAVKERLEKGDFTEIINKHVDEAVNKVVEDLFKKGWNDKDKGEGYKIIEDTIKPILIQALGDSDLQSMAVKTKALMLQLIKESSISKFSNNLAGCLALFDKNSEFECCGNISLKTIFEKFISKVSDNIDKDFCDEHDWEYDEGEVCLTFKCEVKGRQDFDNYEEATKFLENNDDKYIRFYVEEIEELDDEDLSKDFSFAFKLRKDYRGKYQISQNLGNLEIGDLRYSHLMQTYLALAASYLMNVTNVEDMEKYESINVYE